MPALALASDGKRWLVGKPDFLVHVKPLGKLFRAKVRAAMRQTPWAGQVHARAWAKPWVVDCRPVGSGASALKYLAPYIFRIALSNNRIEQVANEIVTFRYTESKTGAQRRAGAIPISAGREALSTANHIFDPRSPDDGRWTIDDAQPSIVYRLSSKAGTLVQFDALSSTRIMGRLRAP